jgi:hypothetical protein
LSSLAIALTNEAVIPRILDAQREMKSSRARGMAQLNTIFREGTLPDVPLSGPTAGQMIAVNMGILTPPAEALLWSRMPWCGKVFDAATAQGDNLFYPGFVAAARVFFPLYRGFRAEGPGRVRGFPFRTYTGTGLKDPDRRVLKIDYDQPENPRFSIRRVVDELVQVADNYYLGKAYLKLSSRTTHLTFYFALQRVSADRR